MMVKPDEITFYAAMRERAADGGITMQPGIRALGEEAERLGIPYKRAHGMVAKWARKGWWDYGVSVRGGWFTRKAPASLGGGESKT